MIDMCVNDEGKYGPEGVLSPDNGPAAVKVVLSYLN